MRGEQEGQGGAGGAGGGAPPPPPPPPGAVWRRTAGSRQKVVMTSSYQHPLRDKTVFSLGVVVQGGRVRSIPLNVQSFPLQIMYKVYND